MSNKGDSIQTEWNQSKATHQRLDKLFSLLHEFSLSKQFNECQNVLYRVLAEASSVLSEDEYEECEEIIDKCSDWESKVDKTGVQKDFLRAERKLRSKLQEHGMMMKEVSDDNGSALGAP